MHAAHRFALAASALAAISCAQAQQQTLHPSELLGCLTPGAAERELLKYPEASFERREGGVVDVTLVFTEPDRAPKVTFGERDSLGALKAAVEDHVRTYRVPCLKPGQVGTLRQNFHFVPTDGRRVRWQAPVDLDDVRRARLAACLTRPAGNRQPDYPVYALRNEWQGNVLLLLSFSAANAAPTVRVLDDAGSGVLTSAATEFAGGWRMPCHEGDVVSVQQLYVFRIEDAPRTVLKDVDLVRFLGIVKGIRQAQVYFDFNEMGCPFDLRFRLHQPHSPNAVGEVGETHPGRRFFLDWLRRQHLDLPPKAHNVVLGQITTVSVPCTVLKLGATSGGSASQ